MLPSKLGDVTILELQQLVADAVRESKVIEYKKGFYVLRHPDIDERKNQHEELLKDVSCLANTIGGDLIIGIEARDGVAVDVCGFEHTNPDGLMLQITELLQQHLEPRLSVSMLPVQLSPGRIVLVVRVPQSTIGPHRVVYQRQPGQFWARSDANAYRMDTSELRRAFASSKSLADTIAQFRSERLAAITNGATALPVEKGPKVVCHIVPLESFSGTVDYPMQAMEAQFRNLPPLRRARGWSPVCMEDGFLTCDDPRHLPTAGYVHMWRNGVIEAVNGYDVTYYDPRDIHKTQSLFSTYSEKDLIETLDLYFKALRNLGTLPPVLVNVTLLGFRGVRLPSGHTPGTPFVKDVLDLPKVEFSSLEGVDFAAALRPAFDVLWNAAGHSRCFDYDASGVFRPQF